MYSNVNFKTKKQLRDAVAAGQKIGVFQPGPFGGKEPTNGTVFLEGPQDSAAHTWYAEATLKDGVIVRVV